MIHAIKGGTQIKHSAFQNKFVQFIQYRFQNVKISLAFPLRDFHRSRIEAVASDTCVLDDKIGSR